jgi:hypothetical protein
MARLNRGCTSSSPPSTAKAWLEGVATPETDHFLAMWDGDARPLLKTLALAGEETV